MQITVTEFEPLTRQMHDFTGHKYGRLTMLGFAGIVSSIAFWWVECECGSVKRIKRKYIYRTESCGCIRAKRKTNRAALTCSVGSCENKYFLRGLCGKHYARQSVHGSPETTLKAPDGEAEQFVLDSVAGATPDKCILWPYGMSDGYGAVVVEGRGWNAHRYALYLQTGINPSDKDARHGPCHNRACINPHPEHGMNWGTRQENVDDMARDGTRIYGEDVDSAKLTRVQVLAIRVDTRARKVIARESGISLAQVGRIKRREQWAWLDSEAEAA